MINDIYTKEIIVMTEKRKLTIYKIFIYCVIFYALWSVRELIIRPVFLDSLNDRMFQISETLMKLTVWTLPAVFLIWHYQDDMWISLKEMFTNKLKWFKEAPIFMVILIPLLMAWFSFGKIEIHPDFRPLSLIGTVIFVGITEEAVFRGWLLNAMLKKMRLWSAILLNAVLFLIAHFPYWIYLRYDLFEFLSGCVSALILSILFSWAFVKSKNIFIPITLHMTWNFLLLMFFFGN